MNPAFIIESRCFDIRQIALSGQCFRMEQLSLSDSENEIRYSVVSQNRYLELLQETAHSGLSRVSFFCPEKDCAFWSFYFDLDTDYESYLSSISPDDSYLMAAGQAGRGIRILRQDLWEMIVSFLISQQNNIPRIRRCIQYICERYGEKMISSQGKMYYAFPQAWELSLLEEDELKKCNLGYRSKYVVRSARSVVQGEVKLDEIEKKPYKRAKEELMKLFGVGEKVADCICLFALHHLQAFPKDTHILQVLKEHYKRGFPNRRYRGFQGVMQQYIFYYELSGLKNEEWDNGKHKRKDS